MTSETCYGEEINVFNNLGTKTSAPPIDHVQRRGSLEDHHPQGHPNGDGVHDYHTMEQIHILC